VNAAEQVKNFEIATKVATIVNLFKSEFPDAKADLKPWANDRDTTELVDPDSIDLGFHFPGWSRSLQSRSILIQIRFHTDAVTDSHRAIGIELAGFNHTGKQWQLSTIDSWDFVGSVCPTPERGEKLKHFCRQVFAVFSGDDAPQDD
jgi:hypothetical protein